MEEIGKSLPALFKRHVRRADPQLIDILAPLWSRAAGKVIAEHSRPVAFWSGTLTIGTPCSTWAAQLRLLSEEIVGAVNSFLGALVVRELRVKFIPNLAHSKNETRNSKIKIRYAGEFRVSNFDFPNALDPETARILERSFTKYFARSEKRLG